MKVGPVVTVRMDGTQAPAPASPAGEEEVVEEEDLRFQREARTSRLARYFTSDDKTALLQAEKICDVFKIRYGFRDRDVEQLVSEHSAVLGYSLKHQILPAVNILEKDLELGLTDYCDVAIRRLVLRVPQMLANDLSDPQLRADFALHAKRVLHLTDAETKNLMKVVPKAGKPLQRLNMW